MKYLVVTSWSAVCVSKSVTLFNLEGTRPKSGRELRETWGISSAGRAPDLHSGGQRFDPVILHHIGP